MAISADSAAAPAFSAETVVFSRLVDTDVSPVFTGVLSRFSIVTSAWLSLAIIAF